LNQLGRAAGVRPAALANVSDHGQNQELKSVYVIRWDEKAGLQTGCGVRSQVIDVLKAQIKGDRQ